MPNVQVRAANTSDLEQLNELMYLLHDEHHQFEPEHFKTAEEIEQEKSIARYIDGPDCVVFVAEVESIIVGFVTGHFCELVSTVSKPVQMGSIDELYILPSYRKQSIAKELCQKIEQRFAEYGVTQLFVEVWNFNERALNFYMEGGFAHHIHWLRKPI